MTILVIYNIWTVIFFISYLKCCSILKYYDELINLVKYF